MFSSIIIHISWIYICITNSATILSSDNTIDDDWAIYDSNTGNGWINGDVILNSNTILNNKYHGLFNSNNNMSVNSIAQLSRDDIQLPIYGTLTLSFTLIFGCDILNLTDTILITVGDKQVIYYWVDAYDYGYATNNYPFITPTFTINLFDSDSILYEQCDEVPGDNTVWSIDSTIISNEYKANTAISISFISKFDYSSPYENDNKYWAVANIQFKANSVTISDGNNNETDKNEMDMITLIAIIVVGVFVVIVVIILIIYCKKKKHMSDKNNDVEMTDGMQWKYTVKGQKITDKTQLKSVFDAPLSNNNENKNAVDNYGGQQQSHIAPVNNDSVQINASYFSNNSFATGGTSKQTKNNNNNENNIVNAPPSLPTIMGKRFASNNKNDDSDDDSIYKMQNKYAKEEH